MARLTVFSISLRANCRPPFFCDPFYVNYNVDNSLNSWAFQFSAIVYIAPLYWRYMIHIYRSQGARLMICHAYDLAVRNRLHFRRLNPNFRLHLTAHQLYSLCAVWRELVRLYRTLRTCSVVRFAHPHLQHHSQLSPRCRTRLLWRTIAIDTALSTAYLLCLIGYALIVARIGYISWARKHSLWFSSLSMIDMSIVAYITLDTLQNSFFINNSVFLLSEAFRMHFTSLVDTCFHSSLSLGQSYRKCIHLKYQFVAAVHFMTQIDSQFLSKLTVVVSLSNISFNIYMVIALLIVSHTAHQRIAISIIVMGQFAFVLTLFASMCRINDCIHAPIESRLIRLQMRLSSSVHFHSQVLRTGLLYEQMATKRALFSIGPYKKITKGSVLEVR